MAGTYSQLLYHVVFSTRRRTPWITADIAERLYTYIGGIIRGEGGVLRAIGGVEDHVHLLISCGPAIALSDVVRKVKTASTRWVQTTLLHRPSFRWQEGFAAFTVSASQEQAVRGYIARQREHHRVRDFRSELLELLQAHSIAFEEKYSLD